jgi:hypothetical protein
VPPFTSSLDFPPELSNALLAAAVLLIPSCASYILTFLNAQIAALKENLETNTALTHTTLGELRAAHADLQAARALLETQRTAHRAEDCPEPDTEAP